jgi:hypothetical protein
MEATHLEPSLSYLVARADDQTRPVRLRLPDCRIDLRGGTLDYISGLEKTAGDGKKKHIYTTKISGLFMEQLLAFFVMDRFTSE